MLGCLGPAEAKLFRDGRLATFATWKCMFELSELLLECAKATKAVCTRAINFHFASKLIETQKAQASIVAPDFEVVVARALPLIEDIDDIKLTTIEAESSRSSGSIIPGTGLHPKQRGHASSSGVG